MSEKGKNGGNPDWKPGVSGNPTGRPKGARCRFGEDFVTEFMDHWKTQNESGKTNGRACLDQLAAENAEAYARVAVAILPKVIELGDETKDLLAEALSEHLPFDLIRAKAEKAGQTLQ
ncbi:MAG: hypothetical protein NUV80_06135 [Candidatus Berkelbacteria bacterium]|nr:hypothetical protein [Candidatus Berkelbacteria bacterium]